MITIEICTASADDCVAAEQGGADRVELNCALMLGGLTPSMGSLRESRTAVSIPIITMIRPRAGGFCYGDREFAVMMRDAEACLAEGASGIAFGILNADGSVDMDRCRRLAKLAKGRQKVFHRAFDVVPDPLGTLDRLIDIGITRVMTSGQEASDYNGAANIIEYIRRAAGRIEILPAGGINRFTIGDVVNRTGCDQIHASLTTTQRDDSVNSRPQVSFGGVLRPPEEKFPVTDGHAVTTLRKML